MERLTEGPGAHGEPLNAVPGVAVRPMRSGDVSVVAEIEAGTFTSPWSAQTFQSLLDRPGLELLVMEHERDGVIGYAVLWCILDQGELANVAVVPGLRGRGFGAHLLAEVIARARSRGLATVFLEVRASNESALALYRRFGFEEVGHRKAYYERPREDARIMALRL